MVFASAGDTQISNHSSFIPKMYPDAQSTYLVVNSASAYPPYPNPSAPAYTGGDGTVA